MRHPRDSYSAFRAEFDTEELRQREALRRYLERRNADIEIPSLNVLTSALAMILLAGVILYIAWWAR